MGPSWPRHLGSRSSARCSEMILAGLAERGQCWALSSQHLLCYVLVVPGIMRRAPDIPEPCLGAGQKLLWLFLFSLIPVGQLTPSWPLFARKE